LLIFCAVVKIKPIWVTRRSDHIWCFYNSCDSIWPQPHYFLLAAASWHLASTLASASLFPGLINIPDSVVGMYLVDVHRSRMLQPFGFGWSKLLSVFAFFHTFFDEYRADILYLNKNKVKTQNCTWKYTTRGCSWEHHLPYGITQCYLPPDTGECTLP